MKLNHPLPRSIVFDGCTYRLRLAFDNVLRVFEVQHEPLFDDAQRLQLSVELLAGRRAGRLPLEKLARLMERISAEFLSPKSPPRKPGEPRVLDWLQDAPYIYASFQQAYGIDLTKQRGRLDWRYFVALFQGLPENTKIREVMSIRSRPLPSPAPMTADQARAEQAKAMLELKAFYAIEISEDEARQNFQDGVNAFAQSLIGRAKRGV